MDRITEFVSVDLDPEDWGFDPQDDDDYTDHDYDDLHDYDPEHEADTKAAYQCQQQAREWAVMADAARWN